MLCVYTDGGCNPNPGPGAWAAVVVDGDEVVWEMADFYYCQTTNNRMEMYAVIYSLKYLLENRIERPVKLFCDSQLVVNIYNRWGEAWEKRGWQGFSSKRVKNLDLVQQMLVLKKRLPLVKVEWVKGHNGNRWNEHVDRIVRNMLKSFIDPENERKKLRLAR